MSANLPHPPLTGTARIMYLNLYLPPCHPTPPHFTPLHHKYCTQEWGVPDALAVALWEAHLLLSLRACELTPKIVVLHDDLFLHNPAQFSNQSGRGSVPSSTTAASAAPVSSSAAQHSMYELLFPWCASRPQKRAHEQRRRFASKSSQGRRQQRTRAVPASAWMLYDSLTNSSALSWTDSQIPGLSSRATSIVADFLRAHRRSKHVPGSIHPAIDLPWPLGMCKTRSDLSTLAG